MDNYQLSIVNYPLINMGKDSKIEWTNHTFNPWRGCTKVSAGCANCYAERQAKRNPKVFGTWGDNGVRAIASEAYWKEPLKWNAEAKSAGVRAKVFCASMADVFEDREDLCGPRHRLFHLIYMTPWLDWILVTKRPENIRKLWSLDSALAEQGNIWLLASIEDQAAANARIPHLLKCRDLSPVLGLSMEPLLGPVDLRNIGKDTRGNDYDALFGWETTYQYKARNSSECSFGVSSSNMKPKLNWVIVGGESGPGARPMHPEWARSLRDQCQAAGVPFFFKQWGEWVIQRDDDDKPILCRVGKKAAGRLLDGREWNERPAVKN